MKDPVTFARNYCRVVAWYGIALLVPQLFMENQVGLDFPPAITHPEFFYGFTGVALVWQLTFLILAKNPLAYRALFIPAALEKLTFAVTVFILFGGGRVPALVVGFGAVDLAMGLGFFHCWRRLGSLTT